jgi:hypothetical protein
MMSRGHYSEAQTWNGARDAAGVAAAAACRCAKEYKKTSPVRVWLRAAGAWAK